jgi:hypothetical protein
LSLLKQLPAEVKYQIGDPIIVLSTKEEGKVVEILSKEMLKVQVGNTSFPIFETEVDHPYLYWFMDKNKMAKATTTKHAIETSPLLMKAKQENYEQTKYPRGLKLIFIPVYKGNSFDDVIEKVRVYLSNNLNQRFSFNYYFEAKSGEHFNLRSELLPYQDFYVHDVSYEHLATNPLFEIHGSEIVDDIVSTITNFGVVHKIKPKQLVQILNELHSWDDTDEGKAYFDYDIVKVETLQTEVPVRPHLPQNSTLHTKTKAKSEKQAAVIEPEPAVEPHIAVPHEPDWEDLFVSPYEVDLHIEKIHPNHALLPPGVKLAFQLLAAEKVLDIARIRGLSTLVLIHGNGKGTLKQQIFSLLDQTKCVHSYVNKDDKRYGLGATEIFLGY